MPALQRRLLAGAAAVAAACACLVANASSAPASGPSEVSVPSAPGHASTSWQGNAPFNNGNSGLVWGQLGVDDPTGACDPANPSLNSQHQVRVSFPKDLPRRYETLVRFSVRWTDDAGANTTNDLAMYLYGPDGKLVAASDGSQNLEGINVTSRVPGTYNVLVCAFQNPPTGTAYTGTATAYTIKPRKVAASKAKAPTYHQFSAPAGVADNAGEPSIGSNWKSGNTLFTSNTDEYVVHFDDRARTSTWKNVNTDPTDPSNKISLDPIGWTDHTTGRTIVSQLYLACSATAYSDDDFTTPGRPSQGCGTGINGFDHQTIGGGPYPKGMSGSYPHAVYYCSQGGALVLGKAYCSRSDDGGVTFGAPVALWSTECSGIHGHVQVGPDGTAYVPNAVCGNHQGVAVSRDGGQTWTVRTIPGSIAGQSDPYVGIGKDNTLYVSYADGTGEARVAISRDHGRTWTRNLNIGSLAGIRNTEFAMVVAGDGDRASVAFLGTRTPGSTQAASFGKSADGKTFTGAAWHLYIATTYDRGATWKMVDATPGDPVQRGCIWNAGGSNPCRNLLDFDAITIDRTGHVMVGLADGCVGPALDKASDCVASDTVSANGLVNHGAIVRQLSGKTLFAKYDR
ncbi:glycoside hydrolase [Nocardioides sp. URHA0032]|uniref:glycoside hydrolase n=1 Tax=Nocardioides sp. URHA0032 TaxID=1380388 RepID=UPI0012DC2548|nr:glycoside hydrolase [Nocardioides sp. URHA0032]